MDFELTATQQAVADVVTAVLDRHLDPATMGAVSWPEQQPGKLDPVWITLVQGGITALPIPERLGGDGVGIPEVGTVLTEVGRYGAVTPALATLGLGVVPLLVLASTEQQDRHLAGVTTGGLLTAALNEPGSALPDRPVTSFVNGRLSGIKVGVMYAEQANWMLVTTDCAVVLVAPGADGVQLTKTPTSSRSDEYTVEFTEVEIADSDILVGAVAHRVNQLALAMMGACANGLVAGALRLTANYVANRRQFGKPLSTFQTVAAQLAEVYIVSCTIDLVTKSVIWHLAEGGETDPQTDRDLDVLGYWIASQAPSAMQICHHLHGGIGMDIAYPMHRYYSTIKDLTRLLGGPSHRLDLVSIASMAKSVAAGRHPDNSAGAQCSLN
ncbi:acyl-CoA dehydrogenase [Mycobacterium uberis]|uniref:Acyl-CoA dehydrogenase n=1 Tax=Mycobacterium uberis TaxID=2162698 RepID=A0A3E1HE21_9MYCO|nr:acyl-CoA dehydrogenase family protein [Mycobacterium uberis]RFD24677.1 acyl-CoA dehydrogenase [Mycobacterium uberis]